MPNPQETYPMQAPPSSIDAERSVIGTCLQDASAVCEITEQLEPEDFYTPEHREIYAAICQLAKTGKAVDLMTVGGVLTVSGSLNTVGGPAYLLECVRFVPTTANFRTYVEIVQEKAILRRVIQSASQLVSRCYAQSENAASILQDAESVFFTIGSRKEAEDHAVPIQKVVQSTYDKIEEWSRLQGKISGVPTGYYDLDRMLTGFHPKDYCVIGARPAMGKTAFAISIANYAASVRKKNVVFFSLEMPAEQICLRLLSLQSGVSMQSIRMGRVEEEGWVAIGDSMNQLAESSLIVDDSSALTPAQMRSRLKRIMLKKPVDLVIVDYLGLMAPDKNTENRQQDVSQISGKLRQIAKDLSVPIIVLSQLSRANGMRGDKRPTLTDLRDSGSIEQDAGIVLFLHREGYYDKSADQFSGEVIVAKQRNGPIGTVNLKWDAKTASYKNAPDAIPASYV